MQTRTYVAVAVAVLAIWLLGTWITKYTLQEMAVLTPIAVLALGALAAVVMVWVKVIRDSMRRRREQS